MSDLAARIRNRLALFDQRREQALRPGATAASITFDDFPASAARTGARILEARGLRGTYYVSGGFMGGTDDHGKPRFTETDLRALHGEGHEIGCHTFAHKALGGKSRAFLRAACDENAKFLNSVVGPGARMESFAYPYGDVSPRAKDEMGKRFKLCRGVRRGCNTGKADLAQLSVISLESRHAPELADLRTLMRQAREGGGWLVFLTHDIEDSPSPYGSTPALLEAVLDMLAEESVPVLPLAKAADAVLGEAGMTVAVIIAAYNAEKTLVRAVTSALAEAEVSEVWVIDDASTDATAQTARDADDGTGRLRVIVQPQNKGPSAARNAALESVAAEWVCVLDSDDFFLPGRIRGLLAFAGEADFIADDMWRAREAAPDGPRTLLVGPRMNLPARISLEDFVLSNITVKGRDRQELGFIKPLMRRTFLEAHAPRYDERLRLGEDYELYARALAAGARLLLVPAQGYVSVTRADSLSGRHSTQDLLNLRDCDTRLMRLPGLSPRQSSILRQHYLATDAKAQWRVLIDAVKARKPARALSAFLRPWPVPLSVAKELTSEVSSRLCKTIGRAG